MNDKIGQSKRFAFVPAQNNVWRVTETQWDKFEWFSNQNWKDKVYKKTRNYCSIAN